MPRGKSLEPLRLTVEQREALEKLVRRSSTSNAQARRARIVLLSEEGQTNKQISHLVGVNEHTVGRWRKRFLAEGIEGLFDLPRSGTGLTLSEQTIAEVISRTLETKPEEGTQWSTRKMAKETGISNESVSRIWRTFGLQPHRAKTFQLSTDPFFVEKVKDVVGLYMSPPAHALVLCVDEKSQIQALERSQPLLPMQPGAPERISSDYFRHGTTTLFAALDVKTGEVHAHCHPKHTQKEFLSFLRKIEKQTRAHQEVHLVMDNYATHKTQSVRQWFARHPRWHAHFIPTHSSWLNQVERFFAKITQEQIRRGCFHSVKELKEAILHYIELHNEDPKPFVWTATADDIIGKVGHLCAKLR